MRRIKTRAAAAACIAVAAAVVLIGGAGARAASAPEPRQGDTVVPLIVGGEDAAALHGGEVSIQFGGRHRCGGSLIASSWVVTAAHCAPVLRPGETQVRAGSLTWATGGTLVGVAEVHLHPEFDGVRSRYDLALLKLDRRVRATPVPIALRAGRPGTATRATGWGLTCKNPARPECTVLPAHLQQLDTFTVDPQRCDLGTLPSSDVPIFDPRTELCVASADGEAKMACNGDSGSGLLRHRAGRWFLVGVTSADGDDLQPRVDDCNTAPNGEPGVGIWARVGPAVPWILDTLLSADRAAAREVVAAAGR